MPAREMARIGERDDLLEMSGVARMREVTHCGRQQLVETILGFRLHRANRNPLAPEPRRGQRDEETFSADRPVREVLQTGIDDVTARQPEGGEARSPEAIPNPSRRRGAASGCVPSLCAHLRRAGLAALAAIVRELLANRVGQSHGAIAYTKGVSISRRSARVRTVEGDAVGVPG